MFQSAALLCFFGCGPAPAASDPAPAAPTPTPVEPSSVVSAPADSASADDLEARRLEALAHQVVFADRITYSYLLLLPGPPGVAPTRRELDAAVVRAFPSNLDDDEVVLLRGLIARPLRELDPLAPPPSDDLPDDASDLLGLAIELHPRLPASGPALLEPKVLQDPDLTRELTADERASLTGRGSLLVLRAQYRDLHAVRGLRLLQTLVRLVASARGGLIHDPDTLETMGPAAFAARRLQSGLGNVADQIPVVPFPDPRHPGRFRLATRGMRRFGSVDLELDGLPADLPTLQQGTFFLHGLARMMIDLGEYQSGFAAELPQTLTLHHSDCAAAYAGRPVVLPRCKDCPESVDIHLVERPAEPQDPVSHVVARIVAPRPRSDQTAYDHPQWVRDALTRVLGPPAPM